jgi:hypothetical protein
VTLELVAPSTTQRFSTILYGPEGSRKSTAACSAPGPILYLNGDRRDGIRFARSIYPGKDIRETRVTGLSTLYETVFYVQEHPEIEEDVNVVLVCHDTTVETSGSEHDGTLTREQMPMTGTSKPGFSRKLMRLVAVVGFCGVMGEGADRRGVAQLIEAGGRRCKDGTGALAGPEGFRDLDLTEWAQAITAFYAHSTTNEETK